MSVNIKQSGSLKQIAAFLPNNLITVSSLPDTDITNVQPGQSLVYDGELSKWVNYSAKIILTYDNYFQGEIITCTQGQTVISKTAPLSENTLVFYVNTIGTWVISNGDFSVSVVVSVVGDIVSAKLQSVPQGSTVTPTDDIQTWLKCANITDKSYTTLAEVLADRSTFETLIADSNACNYMARSTTWALAEGAVPTMTDNTHPSGECIGQNYVNNNYYLSFNGSTSISDSAGAVTNQVNGFAVGYHFDEPIRLYRVKYWNRETTPTYGVADHKYQGSNDGINWIDLTNTLTMNNPNSTTPCDEIVNSETAYSYIRLYVINAWDNTSTTNKQTTYCNASELQFYEADITTNQDAMALIGKYDYCSNALTGNATWASAIANSDYFEEVLNTKVPKMTSDTAPSGQVIYDGTVYSIGYAYKAFNGSNNGEFDGYVTNTIPSRIGYKFTEPVVVKVAYFENRYFSSSDANVRIRTYKIQASNDGATWVDLTDVITRDSSKDAMGASDKVVLNNATPYQYYAIYMMSSFHSYVGVGKAQFYGRTVKTVYKELIPTMTSNTTPSGVASGSSINSDNYDFWHAFDSTNLRGWLASATSPYLFANDYVSYEFSSAVVVDKAKFLFKYYSSANTVSGIFQAHDGSDWINISDTFSFTSSSSDTYTDISLYTQGVAYSKYRWICTTQPSNGNAYGVKFQLIAKTVQTNIVHSCANDTIYYMEDGSPVIVATTNSDGDGILDFSTLENKVYTFYSTIAKNPGDLTLPFTRRLKISKSFYGGTTERYLLPNTIDTLYWYGYISDNLYEINSTNGYSYSTGSLVAPTYNTNNMLFNGNASGRGSGVGTLDKLLAGTGCNTIQKATILNAGLGSCITAKEAKNLGDAQAIVNQVETKVLNQDTLLTINLAKDCYVWCDAHHYREGYCYGFWLDRISSDIPTFISASNDSLYIMDGNTKVYIANTNSKGKSYEPLLEAGTYTIYSSVAKDPNNLSNPYSKTVTVDESTQTIAVMPENTLYWWGYEKVVASTVPYRPVDFGGNTTASPTITRNANSMSIVEPSNAQGGVIWNNINLSNSSTVKSLCSVTSTSGYNGANLNVATDSTVTADHYAYSGRSTLSTTEQILSIDVTLINDSRAIGFGIGFTTVTLKFLIAE